MRVHGPARDRLHKLGGSSSSGRKGRVGAEEKPRRDDDHEEAAITPRRRHPEIALARGRLPPPGPLDHLTHPNLAHHQTVGGEREEPAPKTSRKLTLDSIALNRLLLSAATSVRSLRFVLHCAASGRSICCKRRSPSQNEKGRKESERERESKERVLSRISKPPFEHPGISRPRLTGSRLAAQRPTGLRPQLGRLGRKSREPEKR
ncbi:hypothetical protein HPB47_026326 [Ixodes persulcatus]|uniref:Uncharacterized protein n=1 Tax=Ixodes persulcatus TaxID=34615 RepID=A0AC60PZ04_IXOPE|nr:hypothetical protein HPB47_026326 [Ixodes persulcatus]